MVVCVSEVMIFVWTIITSSSSFLKFSEWMNYVIRIFQRTNQEFWGKKSFIWTNLLIELMAMATDATSNTMQIKIDHHDEWTTKNDKEFRIVIIINDDMTQMVKQTNKRIVKHFTEKKRNRQHKTNTKI